MGVLIRNIALAAYAAALYVGGVGAVAPADELHFNPGLGQAPLDGYRAACPDYAHYATFPQYEAHLTL
jgi:hypothetical protein